METIAIIIVLGLIYYYISNNKTSIQDKTIIKTTETVKTPNGEKTIIRETTMENSQMEISSPNQPIMPPAHHIITPTEREMALQQQLEQSLQEQKVLQTQLETERLKQAPPKLNHSPPPQTKPKQPVQQNKECTGCKRVQPYTEFRASSKNEDGLTQWCKSCLKNGAPNPTDMKGKKVCQKCKQTRLKTSFYPAPKNPDGLSKWCKYCSQKRK